MFVPNIVLYDQHRSDTTLFRADNGPQVGIINISSFHIYTLPSINSAILTDSNSIANFSEGIHIRLSKIFIIIFRIRYPAVLYIDPRNPFAQITGKFIIEPT